MARQFSRDGKRSMLKNIFDENVSDLIDSYRIGCDDKA